MCFKASMKLINKSDLKLNSEITINCTKKVYNDSVTETIYQISQF